ncbi:MAG: hypothetical protein AB1753_07535, partial [Thermoproteota archaeon]
MSRDGKEPLGTFILDFQTTDFAPDEKIANALLQEMQQACQLENQYALDPPVERAGWSFAKLFISGQFAEKIYSGRAYEIDKAKGKKFNDRFVSWLAGELKNRGCGARIKIAPEM